MPSSGFRRDTGGIVWRPRRDLNPCYRRESGMAKRNSNKLEADGRTGWRLRNSRKRINVSPMCPRSSTTYVQLFLVYQPRSWA